MPDSLARLKPDDVINAATWAKYTHQKTGVPPVAMTKIPALQKAINDLFATYPHANYATLVRVTDFIMSRHGRPKDMFAALAWYKIAWSEGQLPELDPREYRDPDLEAKLQAAIDIETHPKWLEILKDALWIRGDEIRREVYSQWEQDRKEAGLSLTNES